MHNAKSDSDADGKSVVVPILETKFIAIDPAKFAAVCNSINIAQWGTNVDTNNAADPKSEWVSIFLPNIPSDKFTNL